MGGAKIVHILNTFVQYQRFFTIDELLIHADSEEEGKLLTMAAVSEPRLLRLEPKGFGEDSFVPKKALLRWFCWLNLRLAQADLTRLSAHQLGMLMSRLLVSGRWGAPPARCVQFGEEFGLVAPAWTADQFVFPVARIVSFVGPGLSKGTVQQIIEYLAPRLGAGASLEPLVAEVTREALSGLTQRQVRILRARVGTPSNKKLTLAELGTALRITRERVRQIESKAWKKLRHPFRRRRLVKALVCHVIERRGSLITIRSTREGSKLAFLTRYIGVPQAEFPHTGISVLGATQQDLTLPEPCGSIVEKTDAGRIADQIESHARLCLTRDDVTAIATSLAHYRGGRLTKSERIYLALRTLGKPANVQQIAEVYNHLFPRHPSTERNLHAVLSREEHGVVWIGMRSTFALAEWGYEHPTTPLFEAVVSIVEQQYEKTDRPVPFTVIAAEIAKRRRVVNPSSVVIAAHCNPALQRIGRDSFVPGKSTQDTEGQVSPEELDRILAEFERHSNPPQSAQRDDHV